jgi:hypothetical protein
MKTETVNVNSWHYRLATTYGPQSKYELSYGDANLCAYIRSVIVGLLIVLLITILGSLLSLAFIGAPIIYIIASILEIGVHLPIDEYFAIILIELVLVFIFGVFCFFETNIHRKVFYGIQKVTQATGVSKVIPETPSFVKLAYRKFKEKTCYRLQSVD